MLGMRQTLAAAARRGDIGPRAVLIAQLLLIAGLAATVALSGAGLSPAGWVVGVDLRSDHECGAGARAPALPRRPADARPTG